MDSRIRKLGPMFYVWLGNLCVQHRNWGVVEQALTQHELSIARRYSESITLF